MPTYEYECLTCKKMFEIVQSINDKPLKKCKDCGGKLKKLMSCGSGVIFKGTGFYETDYKKKKEPKPETEKKEKTEPKKPSDSDKKETK